VGAFKMKKLFILLLILVFFISGCVQEPTESKRILESTNIMEIVDGDTVKTENGDTIRLLHINTAEKGEKCHEEAKQRLSDLILNKTVWIERDMQDKDQYDRKLRYLFLEYNTDPKNYGGFVNLMLLKEGFASLLIIEPNMKYKFVFENALENAEGCLFERSPFYGCFSIEKFNYDVKGNDCESPNSEYVKIKNNCKAIDMNSWTIKDSARHVYTFKDFFLKSDTSFTLHSGSGQDNKTDLFWNVGGSCPVVWNNEGDSLFLRDSDGKLALLYNY